MEKPRIYGDESRLRGLVTKAINRGDDLLAQAEGVRTQMEQAGESWDRFAIEGAWEREFRSWFNGIGRTLVTYLRDQFGGSLGAMRTGILPPLLEEDGMPTLAAGLPPDDGRHTIRLAEGEEWLRHTLEELRELQSLLPAPKRTGTPRQPVTIEAPESRRWWFWLGAVGAVASIIGIPLAIVFYFVH